MAVIHLLPGPDRIPPPPTSAPGPIGRAVAADSLRGFLRESLVVVGREAIFALDVFVKITVSVLVLRGIHHLTNQWWGSREAWDDELLRSFEPAPPKDVTPTTPPATPRLLFARDEFRFYVHADIYPGQFAACPLRLPDPCKTCQWYVPGADGRPQCAPVAMVRLQSDDYYKTLDIWQMRDTLRERAAAANGTR